MFLRWHPVPSLPAPYEPLRKLGTGAQGEVWLARDSKLERLVTLKTVELDSLGDRLALSADSLRVMGALDHPSVARVYTVAGNTESPWLVSEYVEGRPLTEATGWPAPVVLRVFVQLLSALAALQDAGVVHGDVAPGNVVIDRKGKAILVDFGVACLVDAPLSGAGTDGFRAPFNRAGRAACAAVDLWSLGALIIWLLSGEPPHQTEDHGGTELVGLPAQVAELDSRLAARLAALAQSLLTLRAGDRIAIDACLAELTLLQRSQEPHWIDWLGDWSQRQAAGTDTTLAQQPIVCGRSRRIHMCWVVLVLAVMGAATWFALIPFERRVSVVIADIDIEPRTVLPEGFSEAWVRRAVAARIDSRVALVQGAAPEVLAFSVRCREFLCQLTIVHQREDRQHTHVSALPAQVADVVWEGAVSDLGRVALGH